MTVKEAFLTGEGVIDAARQASLQASNWQDFRSRVNTALPVHIAYCLACNDPVYVRAATSKLKTPHFAHYAGGGQTCPWGPDNSRNPDAIRADIFKGNQESGVHRRMCDLVLELAKLDERFVLDSGQVNSYVRSTSGGHGRWPDVHFEFSKLGRFALEVQFAPSLASEVVERTKFYVTERISLLWLLPWYSFEQIERAFAVDIAHEAKGAYFVLDREAESASRMRKTLVLWAAWRLEGALHKELISLDDLTYRPDRPPFLVDTVTPKLFRDAEARRIKISADLLCNKIYTYPPPRIIFDQNEQPDDQSERLIRVLISIFTLAKGGFQNHINNLPNATSMVNAYLSSNDGRRRARIVEKMLRLEAVKLGVKPSVWTKLAEIDEIEALDTEDRWISYICALFPEVYRPDLRKDAMVADILPQWAK